MRLPPSLLVFLALLPSTGTGAEALPPLPDAISNNAVAAITVDGDSRVYSFLGLGPGKTWRDIARSAFVYSSASGSWRRLADVPVAQGRLASVAASAGGAVYLFGGYAVAADGKETSTPDVLRFDPRSETWTPVSPMPLPVDDSVAVVLDDRYVYLVSGWHQNRNVDAVQVYDTRTDRWARATAFPGEPLFGHAGALLDHTLVICDGVKLIVRDRQRDFTASAACWQGRIARDDPLRIEWQAIASHPGAPRYRMGATADPAHARIVFAAGSENPYNYDGMGYDEAPSPASAKVVAWSLAEQRWETLPDLPVASMDHRGMPLFDGALYLIGGMRDAQTVSAEVTRYPISP